MTFAYPNQGTCSRMTKIELAPDHTIESIEVMGGCNGNLKGIASLLKGMKAEDAIARMEGVTCGPKPTSCPDQIAKNLKKALAAMENQYTALKPAAPVLCRWGPLLAWRKSATL